MSIEIDQAFLSEMVGGGLEIDIVTENGAYYEWNGLSYDVVMGVYNPVDEHVEVRQFPADTRAHGSHDNEARGMFQVIVKYTADTSAVTIKQKAEQILDLFNLVTPITYGSQKVFIDSKRRDSGRIEGGFYQIVCRINYRAFITR